MRHGGDVASQLLATKPNHLGSGVGLRRGASQIRVDSHHGQDAPTMGLQLLEFIKGHLPNSRVLIMSSNDKAEVQQACFDAGADEFFDKPFEIKDMLASICRLSPVHRLELIAQIL